MRLEARSVARRYRGVRALDGASLAVDAGEVVAVLGASGSGKSTLVRLLHLLEAPDAGDVLVDGARAPAGGPARLALVRRFGFVQQRPGLLRLRAWENVAFPLRARGASRSAARAEALAWLARLGVASRAEALPHALSGGEAQRVGLARALAPRPDALLLDEATNQLDPAAARLVEDLVREEARRGVAVLLVTHSVAQAKRLATRVAFLAEGRVAEEGESSVLDAPRSPALARFVAYA